MLIAITLLVLATVFIPRLVTAISTQGFIHTVEQSPKKPVAIVFGAGLRWDGRPTPVLRDRVATAAQLYHDRKVDRLVMSGDYRSQEYNEPGAMREFAIQLGVPEEDIILDYAGNRTYDTCYRAANLFGIKSAALITQNFHLPRAVYTCRSIGIEAEGVIADRRYYHRNSLTFWNFREVFATSVAMLEVHLTKPQPHLENTPPKERMEAQ